MPMKRNAHRPILDERIDHETSKRGTVGAAARRIGARGGRLAVQGRAVVRRTFQVGISSGLLQAARVVWNREERKRRAPTPSRDGAGWDGVCRRAAQDTVTIAPREAAILRARIDAIVARSNDTKRARKLRLV